MPNTRQHYLPTDPHWPDTQRHTCGNFEIDISDSGLRNISFKGSRIFDHLFAALRSENWSTVQLALDSEEIQINDAEWRFIRIQRAPGKALTCTTITLNSRDEVVIEYEVEALTNLRLNRWGLNFCIATSDWVGAKIRIHGSDYQLPYAIAPQKMIDGVLQGMFPPSDALEMTRIDGIQVSMESTGLELEMEDQRNWTDSSFKIYSGSLLIPRPILLKQGEKKKQTVKISVAGSLNVDSKSALKFIGAQVVSLPQIGVQLNDRPQGDLREYSKILNEIRVDHVRIDAEHLLPSDVNFLEDCGIAVEVALLSNKEVADIYEEANLLESLLSPQSRILVHADKRRTTSQSDLSNFDEKKFGQKITGTDAYLADLNRDAKAWGEWVSFSVSPTVHSFDSESIFATLAIQSEAVHLMKEAAGGRVVVSPITYRIRGNPDGDHRSEHRSSISDQFIDSRLHQLEGGCWTLGSIHALASAGAASGTWHELFGPRGIVHMQQNEIAYSPTFHALSALTANKGQESKLIGEVNDSWIAFAFPQSGRLVIASLRPWKQEINPQHFSAYNLRARLTEETVEEAQQEISWWTQKRFLGFDPNVVFHLKPYEVSIFINNKET